MNYEEVRRVVEEEVLKALGAARNVGRIRRVAVTEWQVVAAWRRGSRLLEITPGALITPAARDRASSLGMALREVVLPPSQPREVRAVIEAVMSSVIAEIEDRPRAARTSPPLLCSSRRFITASDIELARFRDNTLTVDHKTRITPLALDLAAKYGIKILVHRGGRENQK